MQMERGGKQHSQFTYVKTPYATEILKRMNSGDPIKKIVVTKGASLGMSFERIEHEYQ